LDWEPWFILLEDGKTVQCVYFQNQYQYKQKQAFNYFGYSAMSALIVCTKLPASVKKKFGSCRGIVPARMSPLEIWGWEGPPKSSGTPNFSQLAQNNLADGFILDIDVSSFEPPDSQYGLIGLGPTC
jgi:hypothetical protein